MDLSALDSFSNHLRRIAYPPQMQYLDRGIEGQGFYPGARECVFGEPGAPLVLLLGRDFGTWDYYSGLMGKGRSEYALTWRNTHNIYLQELSQFQVFCTNYLMGVRVAGSAKGNVSEGITPGDWIRFEESCWEFLKEQIAISKPSVIVVFGDDNRRDLDKSNRLRSSRIPVLYGPHPHSAIGEKNRTLHRNFCEEIVGTVNRG
jgi:uracil-DNA glycosylase